MKITRVMALLMFLCLGLNGNQKLRAQNDTLSAPIPIDPNIRIGKLGNGLKYFLKHNDKTPNEAEFRLTINAGSILETEEQQGLAHFLEHMAFNGTRNFEKNELIDYLENLGVEFGADLNAHTSFDETVYKLTIPTDEKETFNDGFQILRDWADGITLSDEEIDLERGVVAEELRGGLSASRRMFYEYIPVITNQSRYADRLPIGTLDVIQNSDYQLIKDFYKDWYRPDLTAVIIVGDIDVDQTEKLVEKYFSGIKMQPNSPERKEYGIPQNSKTNVAVVSDKEADDVNFYAYFKRDKEELLTLRDYREEAVRSLFSSLLNERLEDLLRSGEASFLTGSSGVGSFISDKDAFFMGGRLKEDKILEGISDILTEGYRAQQHGFSKSALERHKAKLLNMADVRRKEDGKINSRVYVDEYIDHFIEQKPIPGYEYTYQFYKNIFPTITLEEVNRIGKEWIESKDRSLVITAPEKESLNLPTEKDLEKLMLSIEDSDLQLLENDLEITEIMKVKPEPGDIIKSTILDSSGVTELQLSNGIKVVLKPTELQNDRISMNAFRDGGSSLAPDSLYVSARHAGSLISESGVNGINKADLNKLLMGKSVAVKPYLNFYEELVSGRSSKKDLENMFQLTHLYFKEPNKDPQIFNVMKDQLVASAKNPDASPMRYFYRKVAEEMSDDHLRATPITAEQYQEELDLQTAYDFYQERFASAKDFTFILVGSFDVETIKPFIKTYLASLPTHDIKTEWKDIGLRYTTGGISKVYHKGEEKKSNVIMRYTGGTDFSVKQSKILDALERVVRLRLYDQLREKMGGVYGVRVSGYMTDIPYEWYRMNFEFSCDPENVTSLIEAAKKEIEKIKEDGVLEDDLKKVKEALRLNAEEGLNYNGYWSAKLKDVYHRGMSPDSILEYESFIDTLSADKIQEAAKQYLIDSNYAQFVLKPEGS